jgi:Family of unknown function (DUF5683)
LIAGSFLKLFLYYILPWYSLLWLFTPSPANAQVSGHYEEPIPTPLHIVLLPDTVHRTFNEDSAVAKAMSTSDTVQRPGKSTTTAMLASMILPGAGQVYNGSYWKVPLIWGLEYYFVSVYRSQNNLYKQNRAIYVPLRDSAAATGDYATQNLANYYFDHSNFYRNQRDTFGWYVIIAYAVNILDAYVDASLFNFEVNPNLQPTNGMRATLHIHL